MLAEESRLPWNHYLASNLYLCSLKGGSCRIGVRVRQWRELSIGVNPTNREAAMLSKEGGGPLNNS